jgi:serine protease Do
MGNEFNQDDNDSLNTVEEEVVLEEPREQRKPRKVKKVLKFITVAIIFGFIAGVTFIGVNIVSGHFLNINENGKKNISIGNQEDNNKIETTKTSSGVMDFKTDVSKVAKDTMPAIVSIASTVTQSYNFFGKNYDEDAQGSGSGIIVGKNEEELLVVTNNHVVEDAKKIGVTFIDDEIVEAQVKGRDSTADLAVLVIQIKDIKEETLGKIQVAKLGNSDDIEVGQIAIAIGNALGYGQSLTVGYIGAKDREVNISNTKMVLLQTDAAINPGNSGGALLNINGEVIGINSVKYASSEVEGMGYAIPISRATPIINDLMNRESLKDEEKGYLGIAGENVTQEDNEKYNMPVGVYVSQVSEDGAAKKAGILKGDIIVSINGTDITTIEAVQEKVNNTRKGEKIKLIVMRNNNGAFEEKEITVVLQGVETLKNLEGSN